METKPSGRHIRLGRGLIMPEADTDRRERDGGEEVPREFVISRGDAPEVFDFVEEALNEIALPVDVEIDRPDDLHVALAGDMSGRSARGEQLDDGSSAVTAVGDGIASRSQAVDQAGQGRLVRCLSGRQQKPDCQPSMIHHRMDLGGQPSTRTANGVIRTPFFPPAAC